MAKRKSKNKTTSLVRKGVALLASVVTFVFLFLEIIAVKTKATVFGKESVETEGVKFSEILFNEDYELLREELSLTTIVMWAVFVLALLAVVTTALALVMKKGAKFAKLGAVLLVVAMVVLFVVNFESPVTLDLLIAKGEVSITNITALYFVALVLSLGGLVSVAKLKD